MNDPTEYETSVRLVVHRRWPPDKNLPPEIRAIKGRKPKEPLPGFFTLRPSIIKKYSCIRCGNVFHGFEIADEVHYHCAHCEPDYIEDYFGFEPHTVLDGGRF